MKTRTTAPLLLFLIATGADAGVAGVAPGTPPVQERGQERGRPTLLHLEDGRVLRAQAREVGGHWEVRQGKNWIALSAGAVTRAVPEKDALRNARVLGRELDGLDPVRRVAYAEWLVSEGLLAEALKELDRVLEADPEEPTARALIAREPIPVVLPSLEATDGAAANLDAYLSASARSGPAVREIAAQRLAGYPEFPGLREHLVGDLLHQSPRRRSFATLGLRRVMPGREVRPLLARAVLDSSGDVREGASLALREVDDPAVIVPVVRALGSPSAAVRRNSIDALATMNYAAAVQPLYTHLVNLQRGGAASGPPRSHIYVGRQMAYVQDYDVEVAQGSAIADPVVNVITEGAVLEAAVQGVHEYVVQSERAAVRRALTRLTGAEPGNTTDAWRRWWKEHGDGWMAGARPPGPPSSPSRRE